MPHCCSCGSAAAAARAHLAIAVVAPDHLAVLLLAAHAVAPAALLPTAPIAPCCWHPARECSHNTHAHTHTHARHSCTCTTVVPTRAPTRAHTRPRATAAHCTQCCESNPPPQCTNRQCKHAAASAPARTRARCRAAAPQELTYCAHRRPPRRRRRRPRRAASAACAAAHARASPWPARGPRRRAPTSSPAGARRGSGRRMM
jgi:hypothetical protein